MSLDISENETKYMESIRPYSIEQKYEMICSGQYGIFEIFERDGSVSGFRGFRKGYGTTGVYDSYKAALEAVLVEFGHLE